MTEKKAKQPPVKKQANQPRLPIKKVEVKVNLNKFFSKGLIYLILGLLFLPF